MFAMFLFVIVFSFYSWLASELQLISCQQQAGLAATKTALSVQPIVADRLLVESKSQALELRVAPSPVAQEIVVVAETKAQVATKMRSLKQTVEPCTTIAPDKKLVLDDITALKIRSARKIASTLGIRQKANGADKSLNCLQQEIRQQLESNYGQVVLALELVKKD